VQQAREAGLLVVALDTPLDPIDAADATFATDNFRAGELIGQWAAAKLGDAAADARIATLDLNVSQPTVDVLRNQGFLQGFGIDLNDPNVIGDEDDPRIVGSGVTDGN
jgi:fructose transport system substrate-binding protein